MKRKFKWVFNEDDAELVCKLNGMTASIETRGGHLWIYGYSVLSGEKVVVSDYCDGFHDALANAEYYLNEALNAQVGGI